MNTIPMQSIKGQLGEALRMRRNITNETWHQIKTAYASGIGLREIARKMGIPPGTILSRVPGGIRTPNLLIRSQKLYPVELQALIKSEI